MCRKDLAGDHVAQSFVACAVKTRRHSCADGSFEQSGELAIPDPEWYVLWAASTMIMAPRHAQLLAASLLNNTGRAW